MAFGRGPLSHPLLVDAIETEFVPVAVRNNVGGKEEQWCERYEEPAWNNPVVRFFAPDGAELLPREDRVWSTGAVAARVCAALEAGGRALPPWLALAREETRAAELETVSFAMHCFWEGEARLGALPGVRRTRAAWLEGHEVVEVEFEPAALPLDQLAARAQALGCADRAYASIAAQLAPLRARFGERAALAPEAPRPAQASDQLHHLGRSPLRYLPLTPLQARRVNAALAAGDDPRPLLAPRQRALEPRVVAALDASVEALAQLARPDAMDGLPAYSRALEAALAGAGR